MISLKTNQTSLSVQNQQGKSSKAFAVATERLSSGLRINSAKDDAAGQAIANRMSSQITGMNQAARNSNDGISALQVGEGAINEMNENLLRMRTLTVQAQNETNSPADLASIQSELDQYLAEINRISEQTNFNGIKPLAKTGTLSIQVGSNNHETLDIPLQEMTTMSLKIADFALEDRAPLMQNNPPADTNNLTDRGYLAGTVGVDGATPYKLTENNPTASTSQILDRIITQSSINYSKGMVANDSSGRVDTNGGTYYYSSIENTFHKALHLDIYTGNISGLPAGSSGAQFYQDGSTKILVSYTLAPNRYFHPISSSQIDGNGVVTADVSLIAPVIGLSLSKLDYIGGDSNIGQSFTLGVPNDAPTVSSAEMRMLFDSKGGYTFIRLQETPTVTTEDYKMVKSGGAITFDQYIGENSTSPSAEHKKAYSDKDTGAITTNQFYKENILYEQADKRITEQADFESAQFFINKNSELTQNSTYEVVSGLSKTKRPLEILDNAINAIGQLRSQWGAKQNRLESVINNLSSTSLNLVSARSRIQDADYAIEISEMTRAQILQQASNSVLTRANQIPQTVLELLK